MSALRWLVDEDLDNDILRGILRVSPAINVVRVQDVELSGASDERVLDWAAANHRILITHDVTTMIAHAWVRVSRGIGMSGVFVVPQGTPIGPVIADLVLIDECSAPDEWAGKVKYLPFS